MDQRAASKRMAHSSIAAVSCACVLGWLLGCASPGPPPPEAGYRAKVQIESSGQPGPEAARAEFVEFYFKGKRRQESRVDGALVVLIDRPDLRISWILNPQEKSFEEYEISDPEVVIAAFPNPFGPRAEATFERVGIERVDGVDAEKYRVMGEAISGHAWFSADQIPLRFQGRIRSADSAVDVEITYSEIRRGPQAAYLFAIPPTYEGYADRKQKSSTSASRNDDGGSGSSAPMDMPAPAPSY